MTEVNTLKNEGLKVYEVGYLLLPTIEESKVLDNASKIKGFVETNNGIFVSEGNPELKSLAYPMVKHIAGRNQKFDKAYFGWLKFECSSDAVVDIKEAIRKMEDVLRFLAITTVKDTPAKTTKFAFGNKGEEEAEEVAEEEVEGDTDEINEKELDDTIDDLVIE